MVALVVGMHFSSSGEKAEERGEVLVLVLMTRHPQATRTVVALDSPSTSSFAGCAAARGSSSSGGGERANGGAKPS